MRKFAFAGKIERISLAVARVSILNSDIEPYHYVGLHAGSAGALSLDDRPKFWFL